VSFAQRAFTWRTAAPGERRGLASVNGPPIASESEFAWRACLVIAKEIDGG